VECRKTFPREREQPRDVRLPPRERRDVVERVVQARSWSGMTARSSSQSVTVQGTFSDWRLQSTLCLPERYVAQSSATAAKCFFQG
jgi:hypothetical protein